MRGFFRRAASHAERPGDRAQTKVESVGRTT